ncbi:hypothetical protein QR680_004038 [Steinernema hermaphroditum]|uniref:EGF-like domain-containing protein n=1 Tax=Steinernema hermaphroditum TaxID=289476 RepID=A0AA39HPP0_9BILA|nr:hypothetical protein QR680_004038 [Steinernema hermaphroditum]
MRISLLSLFVFFTSAFACDRSCQNGGECVPVGTEYFCRCPPGFGGRVCQIDHSAGLTCSNLECGDGVCDDNSGSPSCTCPVYASGDRCQVNHLSKCLDRGYCMDKAANGICDPECNNPECMFDFDDCTGQQPDVIATIITMSPNQFKTRSEMIASHMKQLDVDILKNEEGKVYVYNYDPEQRKTFGLVDYERIESSYASVKVLWAPEDNLNSTELMKKAQQIVDSSKVYDLPIPAAVVQGPMRRSLPRTPFGLTLFVAFLSLSGVVIVLLLITGYLQQSPNHQKVTSSETFPVSYEWNKGVTDITTTVAAWQGTSSDEPLLSDMAFSNDEQSLLMRLQELSSLNARNGDGLTAIALAVDRGFMNMVNELLKRGADPNIADNAGKTPLHRAVVAGSTVAVATLLGSGKIKDIDAVNVDNQSALMLYAKFVLDEHMGALLLDCGARISFAGASSMANFQKKTAVHFAAQAGNLYALKALSSASLPSGDKFDVNAVDIHGKTPLMLAAEYGNGQVCEELIRLGADKTIEDDMKRTAEAYALQSRFMELAEYLRMVQCRPQRGKKRTSQEGAKDTDRKRAALQPINPNTYANHQQAQQSIYVQPKPVIDSNLYATQDPYAAHYYSQVQNYDYPQFPAASNYYSEICSAYPSNPHSGYNTPMPTKPSGYVMPNYLPSPAYPQQQYAYGYTQPPFMKPIVATQI